jgi:hypothetical protein
MTLPHIIIIDITGIIKLLFPDNIGKKIIEHIKILEMTFKTISSFFLFLIFSNITKEKTAAIEAQVGELFSIPTKKSEPFSNITYPDKKIPVVKTTAAFTNIPSKINNI